MTQEVESAPARIPHWYREAIVYQAHVRAFFDSTSDGVGDFPGLTRRLGYLEDLGITCLWLLPFYPSPLKDDGYDIADYENVHPAYGTMDDFDRFIEEATGGASASSPSWSSTTRPINTPGSRPPVARWRITGADFYVWSHTNPKYHSVPIIFDTETSNWTWDPAGGAYYWHRFFHHQPDLNYDNPAVRSGLAKVMHFWLDRGHRRHAARCRPLPDRARRHLREPRGDAHRSQRAFAPRWTRATPTACSWRRPTSGRPRSDRTSAMATSATWRSTFR